MSPCAGRTTSLRLPRRYAAEYAIGYALLASSVVCAALAAAAGMWTLSLVLVVLVTAVAIAAVRRVHELRTHRHIPGPIPSFLTGNLRDIQVGGHGVRDASLVALHQEYGPVVRLHLPLGTSPMVSLDYASKNLHSRDLDAFRDPDRTLLKRSLMGIVGGLEHRRHRRVSAPAFARAGIGERRRAVNEVTERFVHRWADTARVATAPVHPKVSEIQRWSDTSTRRTSSKKRSASEPYTHRSRAGSLFAGHCGRVPHIGTSTGISPRSSSDAKRAEAAMGSRTTYSTCL